MSIDAASTDTTYTCHHEFVSNTLAWDAKSDTFTVSSSSLKTEKDTAATATCGVASSDRAPTAWAWHVAGTDYATTTPAAGVTMTTSSFTAGGQSNTLQLADQKVDSTVTCKVTLDGVQYTESVPVDVITITTTGTTVKTGEPATLVCEVAESAEEPTDVYWKVEGAGAAVYKATTTAAGFTVDKSAFAGGKQTATLTIAAAGADQTYTCHIDYPTNSFDRTAMLDVYLLTTSQVTTQVLKGQAASFTCTVSASKKAPVHIQWSIDANLVSLTDQLYTVTTGSYTGEAQQSVLLIKAAPSDYSIVCSTQVESDAVAPAIEMDVYEMASQDTLSFDTVTSDVVMKLTGKVFYNQLKALILGFSGI